MFPELSSGWLQWILKGADVMDSVFQILGYELILDSKCDHYRLIISDGETWCYAVLAPQLIFMINKKQLEKFTIVQFKKYERKQGNGDKKELMLLDLTVLTPGNEVKGKFGNPVNSSVSDASNRIVSNLPTTSGAFVDVATYDAMTMFPQLTPGAISQILNEEETVKDLVVLVIGLKKIDGCYQCTLFDGVNGWPFSMFGSNLNRMITSKKLETNALIRVNKYEYKQVTIGKPKMIILQQITVLNSGSERDRPQNSYSSFSERATAKACASNRGCTEQQTATAPYETIAKAPAASFVEKKGCTKQKTVAAHSNATGKAPAANIVEKKGCTKQETSAAKVPPNAVEKKGCNKEKTAAALPSSMMSGYAPSVPFTQFLYTMFTDVASGAVGRIFNREEVENAVVQILGYEKERVFNNDRYNLLISDGVTCCSRAMLRKQLNYMVKNKKLEKFTIVRVDKYVSGDDVFTKPTEPRYIQLDNLTVLVPGNEVDKTLGNPVPIEAAASVDKKPPIDKAGCPNEVVAANNSSKVTASQLTAGAIIQMLNRKVVPNAVIQLLGCTKIPGRDCYGLLISDSVSLCPFAMLCPHLNHMINKELEEYSVLRVNKWVCDEIESDVKVIVLLDLTVLVPGSEVNKELGDPELMDDYPYD